jgi:nitrite reductase (NO-forming)
VTVGYRSRRTTHAIANAVVLAYLAVACAWLLVGLPGQPGWLSIHLLLLGAATNAIVTWSAHFTSALLRIPQTSRRLYLARLVALNCAVVAVISGVESEQHAITIGGAALLVLVLAAHGTALVRAVHAARTRRFAPTVRFYGVATATVILGASAGAAMAVGVPARWEPRLFAAHVQLNLLGWITFTVLGTEFTLWPTALRTRMVDGLERAAGRCLPTCTSGLALIVTGVMSSARAVSATGALLYLVGVALFLDPFIRTARRRAPHSAATWMLVAATAWLAISLTLDGIALARSADPAMLADRVESLVPMFITGFVIQVLLGALSYLLPVVLGRGPAAGRHTAAVLEVWAWPRIAALNAGVLLVTLHNSIARAVGWVLFGVAVGTFVVLAAAASLRRPEIGR